MNKKEVGTTLRELREKIGFTVKEVVEKLSKSFGIEITDKALYNYEKNIRAVSAYTLLALCAIYDCKNILKTFSNIEIDCSIPDDDEWEIIESYRKLDNFSRQTIKLNIEREIKRLEISKFYKVNNTCDNLVFMTYYNKLASVGNGDYLFDDIPTSTIEVPKELAKGADFVIGVNGDSMEPTFSDGDKVLVKKQDTINIGEIGIFIDGNDCYIKEKGKNCLVSHNKEYGIIPGTDTMKCVGKVIGKV